MQVYREVLTRLLAVLLSTSYSVAAENQTVIRDVFIVDIERGLVSEPQSVALQDGRIVEIGQNIVSQSEAVTELDAKGQFLIPGLLDSHVHIFSSAEEPATALPLYLINGVTGIRDMGALLPIEDQVALQASIAAGEVLGPRLILAGAWVDASPGSWPGMFLADSPDEARKVVNRIAEEGWAAVKAYSMLDPPTYRALAEAAKARGLPLIGHIPERVSLEEAIEAGQQGMEHFGRVSMACSTREAEMIDTLSEAMENEASLPELFDIMASRNAIILETWDEQLCRQLLNRMASVQMHVSPTLVVADFYMGNWPDANAPRMTLLPSEVRATWEQPDFRLEAITEEVLSLAEDSIALDRRTFAMAHDAGVPILASSDASFANPYLFHGFSLLDELDLYVAAGLTPREALYAATVAPAHFFGLSRHNGAVEVGYLADLVLLDENPLTGLETLRRPRAVIVGGVVLDRDRLDEMIIELRDAAN